MRGEESEEWVRTECELGSDIFHRRIAAKDGMWWGSLYLNHLLYHRYTDKQGTPPIYIYTFPPWLLCTSTSPHCVLLPSRPHNNKWR